jgi:hypothetical protein
MGGQSMGGGGPPIMVLSKSIYNAFTLYRVNVASHDLTFLFQTNRLKNTKTNG